jgi:hypothetical protein
MVVIPAAYFLMRRPAERRRRRWPVAGSEPSPAFGGSRETSRFDPEGAMP